MNAKDGGLGLISLNALINVRERTEWQKGQMLLNGKGLGTATEKEK